MEKILLVEDDQNLGTLLQEYLAVKGFSTNLARDGNEGINRFLQNRPFDLCILDVMMPKKDGFSLAKEIRMADKDVPIIFLTARAMKEDTLQGFRVGGDDYLTKPFSMEELLLRIRAILRRRKPQQIQQTVQSENVFEIGTLLFDYEKHILWHNNEAMKLTSKESELLKVLCQNKNQPLGRSFALKVIWGDDSYFNARSMDVYITKLRKFLRPDPSIQIQNLHGEGFKLIC